MRFLRIQFSDLPVVTCEWLLQCHKHARRLPVKNYLVGDSISPVNDDTEIVESKPEVSPNHSRFNVLRPTTNDLRKSPAVAIHGKIDDVDLGSYDTPKRNRVRDTPESTRKYIEIKQTRQSNEKRLNENKPIKSESVLHSRVDLPNTKRLIDFITPELLPLYNSVKKHSQLSYCKKVLNNIEFGNLGGRTSSLCYIGQR